MGSKKKKSDGHKGRINCFSLLPVPYDITNHKVPVPYDKVLVPYHRIITYHKVPVPYDKVPVPYQVELPRYCPHLILLVFE